jgi:hypothetical protein
MRTMKMALAACVALAGCDDKAHDEAKTTQTAAPTAAATAAVTATAQATAAATAAAPPPTRPGRSPAPTLAEWSALKKEVTVKGSSALRCETKIVREYLRVSCKGKVDPEGTPTGIKVQKGAHGEAMVYAYGGVASLIIPYVEGTDFEAVFSWTKKSHKLVVKWPKGSKQPVIVGVFEGAASPLDGTAKGDNKKLCECHMEVTKAATCEDLIGAADPDCDRTYGSDCGKLLACARGEPGFLPRCLPGWVNLGGTGGCVKSCPGGGGCPAGTGCTAMPGGPKICLPID